MKIWYKQPRYYEYERAPITGSCCELFTKDVITLKYSPGEPEIVTCPKCGKRILGYEMSCKDY